jgi:hypothetical protein
MKIEQLLQAVSESKLNELDLSAWQNQDNQQAAGPVSTTGNTGDTTLNQPLAPKKPGTTLAQKVGGFAKGVGAVAGGVAGIGRAVKKGYAAGANAVGGPGAVAAPASNVPVAPQADQADELAQLRSQLQVMQQKLAKAGIQQ